MKRIELDMRTLERIPSDKRPEFFAMLAEQGMMVSLPIDEAQEFKVDKELSDELHGAARERLNSLQGRKPVAVDANVTSESEAANEQATFEAITELHRSNQIREQEEKSKSANKIGKAIRDMLDTDGVLMSIALFIRTVVTGKKLKKDDEE